MDMMYGRNIIFLEEREIVVMYIKGNAYANAAHRSSPVSNNNEEILIEKLVQLEPNNWPNFQEQPKKKKTRKQSNNTQLK